MFIKETKLLSYLSFVDTNFNFVFVLQCEHITYAVAFKSSRKFCKMGAKSRGEKYTRKRRQMEDCVKVLERGGSPARRART